MSFSFPFCLRCQHSVEFHIYYFIACGNFKGSTFYKKQLHKKQKWGKHRLNAWLEVRPNLASQERTSVGGIV